MRFYLLLPLAIAFLPTVAAADNCEVSISAGDGMAFNTRSMDIPLSCEEFTVNFAHTGRLPKGGMGHNWVLAQTSDVPEIVKVGTPAGLANNYLPENDARVIAATPILGGGENASVTFDTGALSADSSYTFFCSFPGHSSMMRGSVNLVD
ncbi:MULTISPECIES: azurin [unclassified Methylophaga]|jgi:azurin|uniref:azurin n=1 Tax=unclassified Methylophaga TaxID=2629249 RepID=UPI000C8B7423|nr:MULTISPECIES: azurin [unclassified Methylophaga]MAK66178.1 azurin [Methylophaga sp.]MAK68242.1 azurin [Methylophaga sp.]MAY17374.1 azurin [Methylophaga sp.]HAO24818.1 azurin [Methylophaga sp.]HCD03732.1 azurin [Methylophaga sp.]|tara:strand:- start:13102 stop:13551 length:450 start_codon:yes stop_codon:yes gene_type:complete